MDPLSPEEVEEVRQLLDEIEVLKTENANLEKELARGGAALRVAPDLPGSWLELGALMAQTKEYAEAERIFRAGAARLPSRRAEVPGDRMRHGGSLCARVGRHGNFYSTLSGHKMDGG